MAFQPGNKLGGRKEKPFRDALNLALKEAGENRPRLRLIAEQLIAKAEAGDMQAIKEFADRLDGKVPQAIVGDNEDDPINLLHRIERVIVDPNPKAPSGEGVPPASEAGEV